uniref:Uncharacterized protein n=1 Tax=Strongyloides papillosus TaxID=174720 RepID=A0A0N5BL50_STREA
MEPYEDSEYIWTKRTFEDPRFYTASFGKRSSPPKVNLIDTKDNKQKQGKKMQIEEKRIDEGDEVMDPRFYSSAFGKRSYLYDDFQDSDPRLFSTGFGKRSYDMDDPRLFSAAFGK